MDKREEFFRPVARWFAVAYAVISIGLGIYNIIYSTPYYIMLSFAALGFLVLPTLLFQLLKLKPVYSLNFTVYLFCFLAFVVGMVCAGYSRIPYYDKLVHTLSGVFFALIGLGLYYLLKTNKKMEAADFGMAAYCAVSFSLSIAVVWEIFEYVMNMILHNDAQRVLTSGVNDTMLDMIVCAIGSLILVVSIYAYYKKGKKSFLMGVFESFFNKNMDHTHSHK